MPHDYLRIDVTVKNIGGEKIRFIPNPVVIGMSSNQYEQATDRSYLVNSFKYMEELYPGVVKSGSMYFKIDGNKSIKCLIIETELYDTDVKARKIDSNRLLFFNKQVILKFDLSNIKL